MSKLRIRYLNDYVLPRISAKSVDVGLCDGSYGTSVIRHNPDLARVVARPDHSVRGVIGGIRMYQVVSRLESHHAAVYRCPYFTLSFYPESHFLGMARKSRPAIHIHYQKQLFLNGNLPSCSSVQEGTRQVKSAQFTSFLAKWGKLITGRGSLVPKQWAYMRVRARKLLRPAFCEAWSALGAPDGVYLYKIDVFPDRANTPEYRDHVRKSVEHTARLDMVQFGKDKRGENWVQQANRRVNVLALNNILETELAPFRYERTKDPVD